MKKLTVVLAALAVFSSFAAPGGPGPGARPGPGVRPGPAARPNPGRGFEFRQEFRQRGGRPEIRPAVGPRRPAPVPPPRPKFDPFVARTAAAVLAPALGARYVWEPGHWETDTVVTSDGAVITRRVWVDGRYVQAW